MHARELFLRGETTNFSLNPACPAAVMHAFVFAFRSLSSLSLEQYHLTAAHWSDAFLEACTRRSISEITIRLVDMEDAEVPALSEEYILR